MNYQRYVKIPEICLPDRTWPGKSIDKAPVWCSVDLRDGNQALEVPMNLEQKVRFFQFLIRCGFKEIEIGFPAASETDYNFCRYLIENDLIPSDVAIQVLTQSRAHIIDKTMEAVYGAPNVVVHLYNSTSALQRDVVFNFDKKECVELAVDGARMILDYISTDESDTNWILEYSPESYSSTEPDFAVEICDAVLDVWQPTPEKKVIINLPETVEYTLPNVYADMIEYFCRNTKRRDSIIVSLHTHNDRGTGVAASELGLLAGADRVEGTLFGNGERTGNVDIITLAINMMMQGVDPCLDFSDMNECIDVYEDCTGMRVEPRHPWSGKLVFTAFSGSHQDAINKGKKRMEETHSDIWQVPYLPIDPADVGRDYEPIIRINAQSGRGGVAYVLEQYYGVILPRSFQREFISIIKRETDHKETELLPQQVFDLFDDYYINVMTPYCLESFAEHALSDKSSRVDAVISFNGESHEISAEGNGLLDAFTKAFATLAGVPISIAMYSEHAMKSGSDSAAITYIELKNHNDGKVYLGAGVSSSVTKSSVRAIISAFNRMIR
ncbi:2-isopropylmalate synthase [Ruminococcaceae bacterium YRB3002]|nr:2-isopropylmalate synthase [Ruminococcaceae bacterium YRB3002]